MRGDTPKCEDFVKKCIFNCKVTMKRKRQIARRTQEKPIARRSIRYKKPLNGCLALTVKLGCQQLIGQFGIGAAAGFLHHLADEKAQQLSFASPVLFELLGIGS